MTDDAMTTEARRAVEALEAEGFLLMTGPEGTSFYVQEPEGAVAVDAEGHDVRDRFVLRRQQDPAFRAAVTAFLKAERPFGGAV